MLSKDEIVELCATDSMDLDECIEIIKDVAKQINIGDILYEENMDRIIMLLQLIERMEVPERLYTGEA